MEASEAAVNFTTTQPTSFYATPIANIRSELKQFSAILYLGNTPFKDMIINPVKNPLYDPKVQVEGFEYTGYVRFLFSFVESRLILNGNNFFFHRIH